MFSFPCSALPYHKMTSNNFWEGIGLEVKSFEVHVMKNTVR